MGFGTICFEFRRDQVQGIVAQGLRGLWRFRVSSFPVLGMQTFGLGVAGKSCWGPLAHHVPPVHAAKEHV